MINNNLSAAYNCALEACGNYKLGAVIVGKHTIISEGKSDNRRTYLRRSFYPSMHAEIAALYRLKGPQREEP